MVVAFTTGFGSADAGVATVGGTGSVTLTSTLDVAVRPFPSAMVTRKVYAPLWKKVARVLFAAFVPLTENVGVVAPAGIAVADQV